MGYTKGLTHGLAIGIAIGFLTAPRPGPETRARLAHRARRTRDTTQRVATQVQQGWHTAQPALGRAAEAAGEVARAVQPVAQGAGERLMELTGKSSASTAPPVPGFDRDS